MYILIYVNIFHTLIYIFYIRHNRAGEVAQVAEHLPSKGEALSLNPSMRPPKKTKTPKPSKEKPHTT
jgi:hypothetical protein